MKTKKQGKVLALKKKTIANLNNVDMKRIAGGFPSVLCDTWGPECETVPPDCISTSPVPSWDCNTIPEEFTCICEEFRTQCTKCECVTMVQC
jgi:hypothetical protein